MRTDNQMVIGQGLQVGLKKEWPYIVLIALPFLYLAWIWPSLPESVPMHWNVNGEIDRWGNKTELLVLPFVLPFLTYLIFLIIPFIDPKGKLEQMGAKYDQLKFILILFLSVLTVYIFYAVKQVDLISPGWIFVIIGLLFAALGNYFQTIKPNYFVGIRTPWTLENEEVWKKTHQLGGVIWMIGGIAIAVLGLLMSRKIPGFLYIFLSIVGVLALIPIIYSYLIYKKVAE